MRHLLTLPALAFALAACSSGPPCTGNPGGGGGGGWWNTRHGG